MSIEDNASVTAFHPPRCLINMEENKKPKHIVINVDEDMVELVNLVLPRIRGVVSFTEEA